MGSDQQMASIASDARVVIEFELEVGGRCLVSGERHEETGYTANDRAFGGRKIDGCISVGRELDSTF
jgi:hypothetical protein